MAFEPNVPYDGRFTFARIRYTVYGRSGWEFDYPQMERNLLTMMRELTTLRAHVDGSNIHTLDDPELLRYPVAYLSEPGYWHPSEFYGIFEDNDPSKRLMVIVNYNNDIGDFWEWSDAGFIPIELSNEAYKLGVNYLIYAMTH